MEASQFGQCPSATQFPTPVYNLSGFGKSFGDDIWFWSILD